jgi:hypothetical protein
MAECPSCGKPLTDAHMFCPRCGEPARKAPALSDDHRVASALLDGSCPTCGAELPAGARFCGECGTSMVSDPVGAYPSSAPAASTAPYAAPSNAGGTRPSSESYDRPPSWEAEASDSQQYRRGAQYGGYERAPSSFGDYLSFRKMITPSLIQVVFWLFEVLNLIFWIRFIVGLRYDAWSVIFGLVGLVVGALSVRVFLEILMVLFRIHGRVSAIDKKLGEKEGRGL